MSNIFSICIKKKNKEYNWNAWRLLTDFKLLLEECHKIVEKIEQRIEDKNNIVLCFLAKSGIPVIPISFILNLPFFLYKRQHFMIGSSVGTTTLIPFEHKDYLHNKDFFLLDTEVCTGQLMRAAIFHFHRHDAKFKNFYALLSYNGVKDVKKGLAWRLAWRLFWAKRIEYIYSIEKHEENILAAMDTNMSNIEARKSIRKFSFWSLDNEPNYYKFDILQREISEKNYKDLIVLCGDNHIHDEISKIILVNDYINLERLFLEPSLYILAANSIIENIPEFDYDVLCGMSDVGMAFALALAFIAYKKGIFKGQLAYIGRTSGRLGKLVWPDTLNLRGKKILLVDNTIRRGDVSSFSYLHLRKEEKISGCDIAVIMEYGDLEDKKYYWYLHEEGIKIFAAYKHDSKSYAEKRKILPLK